MTQFFKPSFAIGHALDLLDKRGVKIDAGRWQGVPTKGKPDLVTKEILDLNIEFAIPQTMEEAQALIRPNLPWAENHFQERVSRIPSNPGEQYKHWPWWRGQAAAFDQHSAMGDEGTEPKFSHTYQERFWPKNAGSWEFRDDDGVLRDGVHPQHKGIRYAYGDLDDVVNMLLKDPQSRQAYLPIFFPEDTGAVHGGRIPCSLGYHFMLRSDRLHCWYDIRSCDAVRHFRDDLYLATRLTQWVVAELVEEELRSDLPQVWVDVDPGHLFFKAHSFHVHMGDYHLLKS